ncbi:MAG: methylenetetrahydrofolate reductase C-terminal domain-containing protein, partial [Cephaloticoccus sp.]|nr:methylenetetrahydrofolate reductase C-terminal domain-containing protein [Cephaloticoccus sp.]
RGKHRRTLSAIHAVEHTSKSMLYGCFDCGDCSLAETGYLCPRSSCSKNERNGPCGGSSDGRCELDDKDCMWARAYDRLKSYGEAEDMLKGPPVFPNPAFGGSSAWGNYFQGRDHQRVEVANGAAAADKNS